MWEVLAQHRPVVDVRLDHNFPALPDHDAQFPSIRYGERLAEIGAVPSIGTVGDSFDNALAETINGYYKAELIRGPARQRPWKTIEEVELATLGWVHWHNTQRLHGYLGDLPPVEFEALHAAEREPEAPDPDGLSIANSAPGGRRSPPNRLSCNRELRVRADGLAPAGRSRP